MTVPKHKTIEDLCLYYLGQNMPQTYCFLQLIFLPQALSKLCDLRGKIIISSVAQSCLTLCNPQTAACQAFRSITNSQSLLKLMSTESVMPSYHLNLCHSLLFPPSIFPSIRVFYSESGGSSHQVAKILEFQLQHLSFQRTLRTDLLQDGLV